MSPLPFHRLHDRIALALHTREAAPHEQHDCFTTNLIMRRKDERQNLTTVDIYSVARLYTTCHQRFTSTLPQFLMRVIYSHFVTSTATDLAMIHCNRHLSTRFASVTHSHTYANK